MAKSVVYHTLRDLYSLAISCLRNGEVELAYRYSKLIRSLLLSTRLKKPRWLRFCKNCGIILVPGLSASVRLGRRGRMKYIIVRCLYCGFIHRYPYLV